MIWKMARPTPADKKLLADTQKQADGLREDALSLLAETRLVAGSLRQSRERNHYREALDEIFMGRIWKRKEE